MPTLGNSLDFAKYEARNIRAHQLGTAPSSPATGQLYYNTADNTLWWWDGLAWQSAKGGTPPDATTSTKGIVQLAGDLAGTAAAPQLASQTVSNAKLGLNAVAGNNIQPGVVTDIHVASANKDGADTMPSMRRIGIAAGQAMAGNLTLDLHPAPVAWLSMNNQKIISLADPTAVDDAANKRYVDAAAQGLVAKGSVRCATTANITLSAIPQTIDGVVLNATAIRVLVKDQTTPSQNGIYLTSGGAWVRATDADAWNELVSAYAFVEEGTVNKDSGWVSTADQGGTLGTTAVPWVQFSGAGQITSGAGLTKTGNTLDVGAAAGITVAADTVGVATGGVTNAMLAGSIDATTKLTGAVPVVNGGTGQTAAKAARETGLAASGYYSSATHGAGTTITITQATHLLRASRGLIVQVQEEATGLVVLPDVSVAANGDVTVTFGASVTANAYRVTVIG